MENQQNTSVRFADNLLESYVKLGSYIGLALSIGMFVGTCTLSYWVFFLRDTGHTHLGNIVIVLSTLGIASVASVVTFFYASLLWLPILIGLFCILWLIKDALFEFHNLLH